MSLQDGLKAVAKVIPGVAGYFSREEVRTADKLVREHVAKAIEVVKTRVDGAKRRLVDNKKIGALMDLDRVSSRLDRLRNRVRTASYGHSAFFADFKVDEAVLGQLMDFDRDLGERVAALGTKVTDLDKAAGDETVAKNAALALETEVQAIDEAFTGRDAILGK